jgi:hypothetical protein
MTSTGIDICNSPCALCRWHRSGGGHFTAKNKVAKAIYKALATMSLALTDPESDGTAALSARKCAERNDGLAADAVSQSRIGMLLSGVLPCYNPTLMKAYGSS